MSDEALKNLIEAWSAIPDYAKSDYDRGRVDQRHQMITEALETLEANVHPAPGEQSWRVGEHYGIHVYEGDRPVATFRRAEDAARAVADRRSCGC